MVRFIRRLVYAATAKKATSGAGAEAGIDGETNVQGWRGDREDCGICFSLLVDWNLEQS